MCVEVETAEGRYRLRYTVNALCELELLIDRKVSALLGDIVAGEVSMIELRATFWAGLRDAHPNVDLLAAGDVVTEIGIAAAADAIASAFLLIFPTPADEAAPRRRDSRAA